MPEVRLASNLWKPRDLHVSFTWGLCVFFQSTPRCLDCSDLFLSLPFHWREFSPEKVHPVFSLNVLRYEQILPTGVFANALPETGTGGRKRKRKRKASCPGDMHFIYSSRKTTLKKIVPPSSFNTR